MWIDAASGLIKNDGGMYNGTATGPMAGVLEAVRYEPGLLRPFLYKGVPHCTINSGRMKWDEKLKKDVPIYVTWPVQMLQARNIYSPAFNQTALTKEAWQFLDSKIIPSTRQRLKAWANLEKNGVGGFDAMAKWTYEYHAVTDPGFAVASMDGLMAGPADSPKFRLRSTPVPIINSDFYFSLREIMTSRTTGWPLDTRMGEACGRRIGELLEKWTIGVQTGIGPWGQVTAGPGIHDTTNSNESKVYGFTNFPFRVTKTDLTTPAGTNPEAVKQDIIEMRETMTTNGFFGPYWLYYSTSYDQWLDDDYFRTGSTAAHRTLRERILEIPDIQSIERLDYLTSGYQLIMMETSSDVAQAVVGNPVQTVQWESKGGFQLNFKVWTCAAPLMHAPYNGVGGIVHGTTS